LTYPRSFCGNASERASCILDPDPDERKIVRMQVASSKLIHCQVGSLYYMETEAKLTADGDTPSGQWSGISVGQCETVRMTGFLSWKLKKNSAWFGFWLETNIGAGAGV